MLNHDSLDTLCAALAYAIGVEAPACAAKANETMVRFLEETLGGEKVDRIFMYNPDAIAQWVCDKYPAYIQEVIDRTQLRLPMQVVMPSVTPVCFGTMYTGAQPAVHGIRSYVKPVIQIDSIFDALIRAGKKPVIVSNGENSLSKIFLERNMDYFIVQKKEEVLAKAAQLIVEDTYDFIVVYDEDYDSTMHRNGTESPQALAALRSNAKTFAMYDAMIQNCWKKHTSLVGFAMDHGCHDIDGGCGSHGLDMEEDLNISHYYTIHKAE